jgi:hypothetical protein
VRLMIEVAFAVDHAHRHGVLHRDLKPDNILIGEDRRARVTDFGVARILDDTRSANEPCESTLVGSYPYMAPEQAGYPNPGQPAATGEPTPAADIYSLGAIMYELVYGAAPYPVHTREELWRAFDTGPPRPLQAWRRGFDYDLEAVIMKALDRDPAQRYPTAAAFADDLRRSLGRRAPTARARSLRGRLVSTLVHHAAWFSILVAALSISAGAVTSINQTTLRARLLEHANLRQQTTRTARAIERIFKHAAGVTRQLASDPRTLDALASAARPDAPGWLEHLAQDNDLISTVFVLDMDGRPAAHFPHELDSYYQRHFQRRVYFRGARLATQQGLGLDVFVSPLFLSFAQDRLVKLAFSAPVYDANHTQRGVAVATVALETLTREVAHPALSLIAPREGAPSETASPNIELVRVDYGPSGKLNLTREGTITRQVYVANVAHTDYAVVARLEEPSLGDLRHGLVLGIMALVSLCVLTLFLFRRARSIAP